MRLISNAVVLGLGYALGRPDGRHHLGRLRRQAAQLTRHPEVKKLRERGWDVAGEQLLAARNLTTRRSRRADLAEFLDEGGPTGPPAPSVNRH
jgi:hypothetical protein